MKPSAVPVLRSVASETLTMLDIVNLVLNALIQRHFASACVGHELRVYPSPHPGSFETENARDRWYAEDAVFFRFRELLSGLCHQIDGQLILNRTDMDCDMKLICDICDEVIIIIKKS